MASGEYPYLVRLHPSPAYCHITCQIPHGKSGSRVRLVRTAQTKQVKARIEKLKAAIQRSRFAHYLPVVLIWRGTREMINDDATHLAAIMDPENWTTG
jgi:hypothetical protein